MTRIGDPHWGKKMSALKIQCTNPDCTRWLRIPPTALGHRVRCPACQQGLAVPGTIEELQGLDSARHHRLRVAKGPAFVGREFLLDADRAYTVGRSDDCNLQLPGPTVSRRHCSLHWVNNQRVLEDLNTSTGTEVDGLTVTKQALSGGETIEVGVYTLTFLAPGVQLDPAKSAASVVIPAGNAEPLPLHGEPGQARAAIQQDEQALRDARSFTSFTAEHLAATGQQSARRFSLSLATRLVAVAGLLALVTVLSMFGKSWLKGGHADAQPANTAAASGPQLPTEFAAALAAHRFESAVAQIQQIEAADPNDARLRDMQRGLKDSAARYRNDLRADARQALDSENWERAGELAHAAQAAVLGPLPADWAPITGELEQHDYLVQAQAYRAQSRWVDALVELDKAQKVGGSARSNDRVAALRNAVVTEMGCGLRVHVQPDVENIHITVGNLDLPSADQEHWKLPAGSPVLRVTAPGYLPREAQITLKTGQLLRAEVRLDPAAPPAAWVLLALQNAGEVRAAWLAAKHFHDTSDLPATLTQAAINRADTEVSRKFGTAKLRVARLTLKNGEEFTARVWIETSTAWSVQVFPKGDTRTIRPDEVSKKEDLDSEAATQAVLEWIRGRRAERLSTLDTLEELARLRLSLGGQEHAAAQVCGAFTAECLHGLEGCCAACAGTGERSCPECNGKGSVQATIVCPFCKGQRRVDCFECKGSGQMDCTACSGKGHVSRRVPDGRGYRTEDQPCTPCKATGRVPCKKCDGAKRVTCPKCKGAGEITDKVDCPTCKKGRIVCPVCDGRGTREGMTPEQRSAAEKEAAEWARSSAE